MRAFASFGLAVGGLESDKIEKKKNRWRNAS